MGTGLMQIDHVRVEKCGQRGVKGKYCLHMHQASSCPDCRFTGNAIEYGQQRAVVIHGTHLATISENVVNDVRGGNLYIEDGNEMYNRLMYNVAVCPWPLNSDKHGCSVPGTDDAQADTALNQAGIWALSNTNHLIGNRMANHFNGMFYDSNGFGGNGRGQAHGQQCTRNAIWGRLGKD
jgi:hypothetical protein